MSIRAESSDTEGYVSVSFHVDAPQDPETQGRLCDACQKISAYKDPEYCHIEEIHCESEDWRSRRYNDVTPTVVKVQKHHETLKELILASHAGCPICTTLLPDWISANDDSEALRKELQCWMQLQPWPFSIYHINGSPAEEFHVFFELRKNAIAPPQYWRQQQWWTLHPLERRTHFRNVSIGPHTGSPSTLALYKMWLRDCLSKHSDCKVDKGVAYSLPTRLIRISSRKGVFKLKLALGVKSVDYVTLSHRWGQQTPLSLTKVRLPEFMHSIPIDELSCTFRDAVQVAISLGVKYIWIDSLCIIQDSEEDWSRESSTMWRVYQYALCNLSALDASDDQEGLFYARDPRTVEPIFLEDWGGSSASGGFQLSNWPIRNQLDKAAINQRGWVIQERYLARRTLSFGKRQIYWSCAEMEASETCPGGNSWTKQGMLEMLDMDFERSLPAFLRSMSRGTASTETSSDHCTTKERATISNDIWSEIVMKHYHCQLTKPEDKLVAISGLAKVMQKTFPDDYLAGLWRSSLSYSLLWTVTGYATRPTQYRAPSWSWACLEKDRSFGYFSSENEWISQSTTLAEIIVATTTIRTNDITGQVKDGTLQLRGCLYPMKLDREGRKLTNGNSVHSDNIPIYIATCETERIDEASRQGNKNIDGLISIDVAWERDPKLLFCLPFRARVSSANGKPGVTVQGLIVNPSAQNMGNYERWGRFRWYQSTSQSQTVHMLGCRLQATTCEKEEHPDFPEQIITIK